MMAGQDVHLQVGAHLFTPEALQKALDATLPKLPPGRTIGLGAAVDATGASVAVVFQSTDGHWQASAAVAHDWATGDNMIGGKVTFTK
jgi:hypothetical protein